MSAVLVLETACVADLRVLQRGKVDCLLHFRSKALTGTLEPGHEYEKNTVSRSLRTEVI